LKPQIAQMTQMDSRDPRTFAIIGAAIEVHKTLGSGFLEAVYQQALALEFQLREIPFRREVDLPIRYKDTVIDATYRVDFICYNDVIVELKALPRMGGQEEAQTINYLKARGGGIGLLLNFGTNSLTYKRFAV
jgi:GxxExxY protein